MIRISAFVWVIILGLLGVGLFQVKYNVQSKEAELRQINKQINANRTAIHVLDAEWSYLNDPTRLADLARRHTDLTPTEATQIKRFSDLPPRPATAQQELPALSSTTPSIAPVQSAPASVATAPTQPVTAPTVAASGIVPVSATAGALPSAAPAVASATASASAPTAPAPTPALTKPAATSVKAATQAAAKPAAAPAAKPAADEVIDAILADMQRQQQGGSTPPQAGGQ